MQEGRHSIQKENRVVKSVPLLKRALTLAIDSRFQRFPRYFPFQSVHLPLVKRRGNIQNKLLAAPDIYGGLPGNPGVSRAAACAAPDLPPILRWFLANRLSRDARGNGQPGFFHPSGSEGSNCTHSPHRRCAVPLFRIRDTVFRTFRAPPFQDGRL